MGVKTGYILLAAVCLMALAVSGVAGLTTDQIENEGNYTIDQAEGILMQLLEDAKQNKKDLGDSWDVRQPVL